MTINNQTNHPLNGSKSLDDLLRWARADHAQCERADEWKESTARVALLAHFADHHGLVESAERPCSRKVKFKMHRCDSSCGEELQRPGFDHTSMWRNHNGEYVLLSEPYCRGGQVDVKTSQWLTEWCADRDLDWFQSPLPSPYYPGATVPLVIAPYTADHSTARARFPLAVKPNLFLAWLDDTLSWGDSEITQWIDPTDPHIGELLNRIARDLHDTVVSVALDDRSGANSRASGTEESETNELGLIVAHWSDVATQPTERAVEILEAAFQQRAHTELRDTDGYHADNTLHWLLDRRTMLRAPGRPIVYTTKLAHQIVSEFANLDTR